MRRIISVILIFAFTAINVPCLENRDSPLRGQSLFSQLAPGSRFGDENPNREVIANLNALAKRKGLDYGLQRGSLSGRATPLYETLCHILRKNGLGVKAAERLAQTIAKMKQGSLEILYITGVITEVEKDIFIAKDAGALARLDDETKENLTARLRQLTESYQRKIPPFLRGRMMTRLVPVEIIEALAEGCGTSRTMMMEIIKVHPNFPVWLLDAKAKVKEIGNKVGGTSNAWDIVIAQGLDKIDEWVEKGETKANEIKDKVGGTADAWRIVIRQGLDNIDTWVKKGETKANEIEDKVGGFTNAWLIIIYHGLDKTDDWVKKAEARARKIEDKVGGARNAWLIVIRHSLDKVDTWVEKAEITVSKIEGKVGGTANAWDIVIAHGLDNVDTWIKKAEARARKIEDKVGGARNAWGIIIEHGLDKVDTWVEKAEITVSKIEDKVGGTSNAWDIIINQGLDNVDTWVKKAETKVDEIKDKVGGITNARHIVIRQGLDDVDTWVKKAEAKARKIKDRVGGASYAWEIIIAQGLDEIDEWVKKAEIKVKGMVRDEGLTDSKAWIQLIRNGIPEEAAPLSEAIQNRARGAREAMLAPGSRFGKNADSKFVGIVKEAKAVLKTKGRKLPLSDYIDAGKRLAYIATGKSGDLEAASQAMDALEDILTTEGLSTHAYNMAIGQLGTIGRAYSELIRPSTLRATEDFLLTTAVKHAANAEDDKRHSLLHSGSLLLQVIIMNRSDLADSSTIYVLKGLLTPSEKTQDLYYSTAKSAADTLLTIARKRSDLADQAINAFRDVLMARYRSGDLSARESYKIAADSLASIAALDALEHVLIHTLEYHPRLAVVNALGNIAKDKSRLLRPSTVVALQGMKKAEAFSVHEAIAVVQGSLLAKRPDIFSQTSLSDVLSGLGLHAIRLAEGGNARDTTSAFAEGVLSNVGRLKLKKLQKGFPVLKLWEWRKMAAIKSLEEMLPHGCTFVKAAGRTLIYKKPDGKFLALKFLKSSERREEGILEYESEFFDWMNENKETLGLKSTYPKSYLFEGKRVIRVEDIGQAKAFFGRQVDTEGNKSEVDIRDGRYTFMAYEADESYFRYLNGEDVSEEEFLEGSRRSMHDLFTLARHGVIHTSLIELFHNVIQRGREDGGRYLWMVGIMREFFERSGAGMIHAWDAEVRYPNPRVSGVADLAELGLLYNIAEPGNRFNPFPKKGVLAPRIKNRFGDNTEHVYLASYLGDYLLAYALVIGDYYKKKGKLDWQKPEELAQAMKEAFSQSLYVFMENRDSPKQHEIYTVGQSPFSILDTIDFTRLARQMAFFMSGEYKDYVEKDIPDEIFGIKGIRIEPGDGWGHIQAKLWRPEVIEKYLDYSTSNRGRTMPHDVFVFKPDFETIIEKEQDPDLRSRLKELHAKYSRGWRFDGIHEDLGPINGPLSLQELIKALYVTTSLMVADASDHPIRGVTLKRGLPESRTAEAARRFGETSAARPPASWRDGQGPRALRTAM